MKSVSIENFVKTIYILNPSRTKFVRTGTLATQLNISNAAISDMAKKLHQKKLITYVKYKGLKLTKNGEKQALNVLRKHRLWETFLHKVLGLSMHEIHQEAEVLEHVTSDFLAQKIDDYLGQPTKDPHGTPIPSSQGKITPQHDIISIDQGAEKTTANITKLSASDIDFFHFCQHNDIALHTPITIIKQYPTTQMTAIATPKGKILLPHSIAQHIFIKKTTQ